MQAVLRRILPQAPQGHRKEVVSEACRCRAVVEHHTRGKPPATASRSFGESRRSPRPFTLAAAFTSTPATAVLPALGRDVRFEAVAVSVHEESAIRSGCQLT